MNDCDDKKYGCPVLDLQWPLEEPQTYLEKTTNALKSPVNTENHNIYLREEGLNLEGTATSRFTL